MGLTPRNGWLVLCAAVTSAVAALDAAVGGPLVLITLLSAGPLLASTRLGPGATAAMSAYALALGVVLGVPDHNFATVDHLVRLGVLAAICAAAMWVALLGQRLRSSRDQLEVILEGVADGVTAQDRSGRLVFANRAAVRAVGMSSAREMLDAPRNEVVQRFEILDEEGHPLPHDRLPGRRALRGESPEPTVLRYRAVETGEERWSVVKATPIRNKAGEVELAISIMEDVTERMRAQRAERFLSESSKLLSTSLDYGTTLRRVADLAVAEIADWCGVDVVDERGNLDRVALAAADPKRLPLADELRADYPPDPEADAGTHAVLRSGKSALYPEVPDELLRESARDERHLELMRDLGLKSAMIVPMIARGRPVGVISFVASDPGRRYDDEDLALAEELGRRAAIAVDNARLYSERAYIARALQESLLPPALPEIPGVDVAARFRAAGQGNEVGGDFYDLFDTGRPRRWAVVIGDVCGKGAPAAAITALARYTLRAAAMQDATPSEVLRALNDAMVRQRSGEQFCTVAFAHLERNGDGTQLTVATGGHPLPLVLRADGSVDTVGRPGMLLGVTGDPELSNDSTRLEPGDAVVLYTDGVTDARAPGRILSQSDLCALLGDCSGLDATAIAARIEQAATAPDPEEPDGPEPRDDVAILVLRVLPEGAVA
jgi:PAS domain S-box-containing protein